VAPGAPGATPWGPAAGLEYASFWRRFGGYLLDDLIIAVPIVVIASLVLPSGGVVPLSLIGCAVSALYFGVLVAGWGSTLGQRLVGVRVVRQEDTARNLPIGRALARSIVWWGANLLAFVSGAGTIAELVVLLCLLWVAWDPKKQGLHDKLGRALVVKPSRAVPAGAYGAAYPYPAPGYLATPPQYPATPPQYPTAPPEYPAAPPQYPGAPPQYPPTPSQ
jgi:uncharacterized RDD family membrane protein YckC